MRPLALIVMALAAVGAACGSDDATSTTSPPPPASLADTTPATTVHLGTIPAAAAAATSPSSSGSVSPVTVAATAPPTSARPSTIPPVANDATAPPSSASLDTIPVTVATTVTPTETTARGTVQAVPGAGEDTTTGERYPPVPAELDLSPLPQAITEEQGRTDPGAVARQWAGVKVLTSGVLDGPLWPLSVGPHLRALSDPTGQWLPNARLQAVEALELEQLDPVTATVTVRVEALDPTGAVVTRVYDIELWLSDDGYWLVAFADLQT